MTPHLSIKKSFILSVCLLAMTAGVFASPDYSISDKLLKTFKQTFPDAQQVVWSEQGEKYTVNFKQNDILTKVEYDRDGNFVNSLRYYTEKNLPVTILCRLQKKYADKTVFGVTEVSTDSTVEYFIKLEDATSWTTVRANIDGGMQVVEKYKKAS
jgi:hypothetical protein